MSDERVVWVVEYFSGSKWERSKVEHPFYDNEFDGRRRVEDLITFCGDTFRLWPYAAKESAQ